MGVTHYDARQDDRCDVCSTRVPRRELVRTNFRFLIPAGTNYFIHSSYHTDQWTVDTATDKDTIGYGPHGDRQRMTIPDSNTLAYVDCAQTWLGTGTYRSVTAAPDVSGLTQFVVSADVTQVIRYASNVGTASDLTVAMGLCDSAGANKALQRTFTGVNSLQRVWFQMDVADIASPLVSSGIYVYMTVTPDTVTEQWLIDDATLEGDVAVPTQFLTAAGAARSVSVDTKSMAMLKVCPNCRERLLLESEQYGRPREQRVEAPVTSAPQQV